MVAEWLRGQQWLLKQQQAHSRGRTYYYLSSGVCNLLQLTPEREADGEALMLDHKFSKMELCGSRAVNNTDSVLTGQA